MSSLQEKVRERYIANRGVMGGPGDTPDGHAASMAFAKLGMIREILGDPSYDLTLRASIREVLDTDNP